MMAGRVPVAPRRVVARTGLAVLALITLTAVLSGCGGSPPAAPGAPGAAEIVADGPDCLADELLSQAPVGPPPPGTVRTAPVAGSVPEGFTPDHVVLCRAVPVVVRELEPFDPSVMDLSRDEVSLEDLPLEPPASVEPSRADADVTVLEVTLAGDLTPLLKALARPSDPVPANLICSTMAELKPQIYLVDADGRAVRPQWPVTACGFLQDGAAQSMTGLDEVGSVERTRTAT